MAYNSAHQPLLSAIAAPTTQNNSEDAPKRTRTLRRVRSAPLVSGLPDLVGPALPPCRPNRPFSRKVARLLIAYLALGPICFYVFRDQIKGRKTNGILDAIYFFVVTITTTGSGDLVPNSKLAKILACAFAFTEMSLIGFLLSKAAHYLVDKQTALLVKATDMHKKGSQLEILKETKQNGVIFKSFTALFLLVVLVFAGTIFLCKAENLNLVDALYCVCSSLTPLGNEANCFSTVGGRLFAVFWILAGTICLDLLFLFVAELVVEKRTKLMRNWILNRSMTNEDMEAADLDHDGVVGVPEFVLLKLKELGKISQEDITLIVQKFEELDADEYSSIKLRQRKVFA